MKEDGGGDYGGCGGSGGACGDDCGGGGGGGVSAGGSASKCLWVPQCGWFGKNAEKGLVRIQRNNFVKIPLQGLHGQPA